MPSHNLATSDDLLVCTACGAQYETGAAKSECRICDDVSALVCSDDPASYVALFCLNFLACRCAHEEVARALFPIGRALFSVTRPQILLSACPVLCAKSG